MGLIERVRRGLGKPNVIYVKNFIGRPKPGESQESQIKNCENHKSGIVKTTNQEMRKSQANNTDLNKTDFSDTDPSIYPAGSVSGDVENVDNPRKAWGKPKQIDGMDKISAYRELVRENISYEALLQDNPYDKERLDGFVELIVEVCCSSRPTIRIKIGRAHV